MVTVLIETLQETIIRVAKEIEFQYREKSGFLPLLGLFGISHLVQGLKKTTNYSKYTSEKYSFDCNPP